MFCVLDQGEEKEGHCAAAVGRHFCCRNRLRLLPELEASQARATAAVLPELGEPGTEGRSRFAACVRVVAWRSVFSGVWKGCKRVINKKLLRL